MIGDYFGENGLFARACDLYRARALPAEVLSHAESLGRSRIAFCLGYAFAVALKKNGKTISDEDLKTIAERKITYGDPRHFIEGFRRL